MFGDRYIFDNGWFYFTPQDFFDKGCSTNWEQMIVDLVLTKGCEWLCKHLILPKESFPTIPRMHPRSSIIFIYFWFKWIFSEMIVQYSIASPPWLERLWNEVQLIEGLPMVLKSNGKKCHGLGDLGVTSKTNELHSYIDRWRNANFGIVKSLLIILTFLYLTYL